LGFSKGANQRSVRPFDEIAFHKARQNLEEILGALGLHEASSGIDACFTAAEPKLGFASVVRCGLGKEIEAGKYATSGDVVRSAIDIGSPARRFFDACTDRFLGRLPPSVRVVVFLGLDGPYVEALFQRMKQLHPSIQRLSELAYTTDSVTFVHVIHPSPLATSHRQKWLINDDSSLAGKRREVRIALGKTHDEGMPPAPLIASVSKPKSKGTKKKTEPRLFNPETKIEDLIDIVLSAIRDGSLDADVIENMRTDGTDLKKLLRLRRADGEEFAIQRSGQDFRVWSSLAPASGTRLSGPPEEYPSNRNRHSNLGCMPKLRGPKGSVPGARAWKLRFDTPLAALNFIA
jgi:hypothetical protein